MPRLWAARASRAKHHFYRTALPLPRPPRQRLSRGIKRFAVWYQSDVRRIRATKALKPRSSLLARTEWRRTAILSRTAVGLVRWKAVLVASDFAVANAMSCGSNKREKRSPGIYGAALEPREQPEGKTSSGRTRHQARGGGASACTDQQVLVCDKKGVKHRESQRDAEACKGHASAGSTNPRPI